MVVGPLDGPAAGLVCCSFYILIVLIVRIIQHLGAKLGKLLPSAETTHFAEFDASCIVLPPSPAFVLVLPTFAAHFKYSINSGVN